MAMAIFNTAEEVLEELDSWFGLESANWIMLDRNGDGFQSAGNGRWERGLGETQS